MAEVKAAIHDEDLIQEVYDEVEWIEERQRYRDWLRECGEVDP